MLLDKKSSIRSSGGSVSLLEHLEQRLLLTAYAAGSYPAGISITENSTFGAGTFTLGAAVTIDAPGITVTGAGNGVSILLASGTGFNMVEVDESNVLIEDMTLDGDLQDADMIGINVVDSDNVDLDNMTIMDFGSIAVKYDDAATGTGSDISNLTLTDNLALVTLDSWTWGTMLMQNQPNGTILGVDIDTSRATGMLLVSFFILLTINLIQRWNRRHIEP